mgnify:CR=1 FL=1
MKNKLKNLLTVSLKDPAIRSEKQSVIDLTTVSENINQLLNFLSTGIDTTLNVKFDANDVIHKLRESSNYNEFLFIVNDYNLSLTNGDDELLKKDFENNKEVVIKRLQFSILSMSNRFQKMNSDANKYKYQNNIETLYVGAYFLYGKDIEDNIILSPLICYPIELNITSSTDQVVVTKTNPVPNEILLQHIKNIYSSDLSDVFQYKDSDFDIKTIINNFIKSFSTKASFSTKEFEPNHLEKFQELNGEELKTNEFYILNFACIELINPTGGCIKRDIEQMGVQGIDDPFDINLDFDAKDKHEDEIIQADDLLEVNNILNIYQKYAIKSALSENTLIIGPPGTGKSEVIATIIANAVFNKKRILMSSEKAVALEVLRDRLQALSNLCLFIYDSKDKTRFYDCLKKMHNTLIGNGGLQSYDNDLLDNNDSYRKLKSLIEIYENINEHYANSFDAIFAAYNEIDKEKYIFLKQRKILESLKKFALDRNISYQKLARFCFEVYKSISIYKNDFDKLISYDFDRYDKESLSEIIHNRHDLLLSDTFFYELLTKNKIINKISLSEKLFKKHIDVNKSNIVALFEEFNSIELFENIDKKILTLIASIDEIDNLDKYLTWYDFDQFLVNNDFSEYDTLDASFKKYIANKQDSASTMDEAILYNYVSYLKKAYYALPEDMKTRINICLSKAELSRKPDINKTIKEFYDVFNFLFPIWICSPEKTCVLTPLQENIFDYGIFDEASQMFAINAYPLIYRCKTNIVSGDPNQMSPTNWFESRAEVVEEDDDDMDDELDNSLLEKATTCNWPSFHLKNHYRSERADLIKFSNDYIYDNELEFSTRNGVVGPGIESITVNGTWDEKHNPQEANEIIKILKDRFEEYKDKKIIILAFSKTQADFFEDLFISEFNGTEIYNNYLKEKIIVRNLESIQGDEADIVFMTIAFAKKNTTDAKVSQKFGVLSKPEGFKRLNVAATRAKEKMIIVKSIYASDVFNVDNEDVTIFKNFLSYIDNIDKNENTINLSTISQPSFTSDFQEEVYNKILQNISNLDKYKLLTQYPVGKKTIDFAIYDTQLNRVALGVKLNSVKNRGNTKSRLEDLDRQNFLLALGYKILRITELEWRLNSTNIINKIASKLN